LASDKKSNYLFKAAKVFETSVITLSKCSLASNKWLAAFSLLSVAKDS
jgi:hypothetical protein